jgi:hypothetical protein
MAARALKSSPGKSADRQRGRRRSSVPAGRAGRPTLPTSGRWGPHRNLPCRYHLGGAMCPCRPKGAMLHLWPGGTIGAGGDGESGLCSLTSRRPAGPWVDEVMQPDLCRRGQVASFSRWQGGTAGVADGGMAVGRRPLNRVCHLSTRQGCHRLSSAGTRPGSSECEG